jgi:hypothetical protein
MVEAEATEEIRTRRGRAALTQVAGVGMALMGSSLPTTAHDGAAHVDHGYAPARWAAAAISGLGWVIGGIALPLGIIWLVVVGGVLQVVAIVVNLGMNAAGYGAAANDHWAHAKQQANEQRAAQH